MHPVSQTMDEMVVRAERSRMSWRFDKRVFRVGSDIVSLGGSALSVLTNVPSLVVDMDGKLSLRGNSSVRVLINGSASSMVSEDVSALRSIPASMIERVEIITAPSSKYSAEGSGGIINIVLKKKKELGFNGSVNAGVGYPSDHEVGADLNYRVNNVNFFVGGGLAYRRDSEEQTSFQRFSSPDTAYMYREVTDDVESEYDADVRVGADFFLSKKERLTASAYLEVENGKNESDVIYTDYAYEAGAIHADPAFDAVTLQRVLREKVGDPEEKQLEFNLEYENSYDGEEHRLTAEVDFDISREQEHAGIIERTGSDDIDPLFQRVRNSQESMSFSAEADYIRPLGQNGKLETGVRASFDRFENSYRFERRQNGSWGTVPAFDNDFIFDDNVNAAYLIVGSEFGSFSGQAGLRLENTRIHYRLGNSGAENEQSYTNLFPSAFLSYSFDEQQSAQLSYSRRLNRPRSRMLLPFTDYSDSRSRFAGNPDLRPEYSNLFEAGYLRDWESGSLLASLYYRRRSNVIERITIIDGDGLTRWLPINLATEDARGMEFSIDQEIIDGLTVTANVNAYRAQTDGRFQGQLMTSDTETFQARFGVRWKMGDVWNLQASARHRAPRETTQGRRAAMTFVNAGASRELLGERAAISLNVRNILDSGYESTVTDDGDPVTDFYSHREFRWFSRSFSLSLQYHF